MENALQSKFNSNKNHHIPKERQSIKEIEDEKKQYIWKFEDKKRNNSYQNTHKKGVKKIENEPRSMVSRI